MHACPVRHSSGDDTSDSSEPRDGPSENSAPCVSPELDLGPRVGGIFAERMLVRLTNRKHVVIFAEPCHGSLSGSRAFYTLNSESSVVPIKSYLE
jgi:hypothetical protein